MSNNKNNIPLWRREANQITQNRPIKIFRNEERKQSISHSFKSSLFKSRTIKGIDDIYEWYNKDTTKSEEKTIPSSNGLPENKKQFSSNTNEVSFEKLLKEETTTTEAIPKPSSTYTARFNSTTYNTTNIKGIDQIFSWYNKDSTKSEEQANSIRNKRVLPNKENEKASNLNGQGKRAKVENLNEVSIEKLLKEENTTTEAVPNPASTNTTRFNRTQARKVHTFSSKENRKPDTWCSISKDVAANLIEKHSLKYYSDEDFINRFFRFESAYYEYLDDYVYTSNAIKKCTLFAFIWHMHNLEPSLRTHVRDLDNCYKKWINHKRALPTYGAAILSEDASHVVMVQSAVSTSPWGFPKGKVNSNENPVMCAIREVEEEIGFDITHRIREDYYIEYRDSKRNKFIRLYIIEDVSMNTEFTIKCYHEVQAIKWKRIGELQGNRGKIKINSSSKFLIDKLKSVGREIKSKRAK